MSARERALYGACQARLPPTGPDRPEVIYQRQRPSPDRLNNSTRRTYDLLRSTLVTMGRSVLLVEGELTDALSASRSTVRAVLQQLAREGLVTREPKNGTRATGALLLRIDQLSPVAQFGSEPSTTVEARTLECRPLGCPPMVRDRLRLPVGWTVLMIESLVLENGLPLGLSVSYIALGEDQSPDFDIEDPDVILVLERQLGIRIGVSRTTVSAVVADEQSAELLGIESGAPLIWLEDVIEDEDGQPRALSQLRLRGDRVAFSATARRSA
ncbi:MAG: GntR family transcriptional regulator [Mycobacterium sp.]|jgi:GntR family transcriptional regulator|nr:GntR family transcriptional regulator [Mycobacterium sp.]MDT5303165.1 GntR family transcriptional regulator [Mycobacterium sp.]MDT5361588.1 GntR family transcriptional regulator [Mycobacterium sp.]